MAYADYIGRTVDLRVFANKPGTEATLLTGAIGGASGAGEQHTGIFKLAQNVLILLQTPIGSIPHLPNYGCDFWSRVTSGSLLTPTSVKQAFAIACNNIVAQLRADETNTTPDDERIASIVLTSLSVNTDSAVLYAAINSVAGESRPIILPLTPQTI